MRPKTFSYTPAAASASGFASAVTGTGPFVITTTVAGDGLAHTVTLGSAANLSAITFTITGTDADGKSQVVTITGPNATTVTTTQYFGSVTLVSASSTLAANTMNIGWSGVSVSPTIPMDWRATVPNVTVQCVVTGTINYSSQYFIAEVWDSANPPAQGTWTTSATITGKTATFDGGYTAYLRALRLLVNSVTAGATIKMTIIDGGTL